MKRRIPAGLHVRALLLFPRCGGVDGENQHRERSPNHRHCGAVRIRAGRPYRRTEKCRPKCSARVSFHFVSFCWQRSNPSFERDPSAASGLGPLNSALGVLSIRATTDGETRRQLVSRTVLVKPASLLTCHRPPPHAEGCIALTNKSRRRPLNGSRKKSPCSILFIATLSKVGARKTPNPTFNRTPFRRRLIPRYATRHRPTALQTLSAQP